MKLRRHPVVLLLCILAALAFLSFGALSLFLWKDHGLAAMLASFGGLHLVLGAWVLWKRRA